MDYIYLHTTKMKKKTRFECRLAIIQILFLRVNQSFWAFTMEWEWFFVYKKIAGVPIHYRRQRLNHVLWKSAKSQ